MAWHSGRWLLLGVLWLAFVAGAFFVGAGRGSSKSAASTSVAAVETVAPDQRPPADAVSQQGPRLQSRTASRPSERDSEQPAMASATDVDPEQRDREQRAKDLVDLLRSRVADAELFNPVPGNPESAANATSHFVQGWASALTRVAPDLVGELASQLQHSLCASETSDAELIVMSNVIMEMPELANPAALDCVFTNRAHEDVVLWAALDAWKRAQLPKTPALDQIERSATDRRTLRRLQPEPGDSDREEDIDRELAASESVQSAQQGPASSLR